MQKTAPPKFSNRSAENQHCLHHRKQNLPGSTVNSENTDHFRDFCGQSFNRWNLPGHFGHGRTHLDAGQLPVV